MVKILLLEPDGRLSKGWSAILHAQNLSAIAVQDAQEATDLLLGQEGFDLVLAALPPAPGAGAHMLRKLRSAAPDASILVTTAEPDFTVAVQAMRLGACDCLVKPISAEDLVAAVRRALQAGSVVAELKHRTNERTRELRESEAFFSSLVENIAHSVLRKDRAGRFTFANGRFCASVARTLEEIRGKRDADFYPADLAAKYITDDEQVMTSGQPWEGIEEHRSADGQARYVHVLKSPLYSTDGKPAGLQCIFWDITAQKQADEQLRKLAQAVEQSPASIVITNRQGNIEFVNPKFTQVTGYSLAEVTGKNPRILKTETLSTEVYRDLWATITAGREWRGEFHNRRKDGTCFWEAASISGVRDGQGRITHFIAVKEDISARKRMEGELAAACQAALASTRAKTEFLANMSHEIRTPMNGVLGLVNLLLDSPLTEEQKELAEAIRQCGDSLLSVINDVLDFSKLEAGKLVSESHEFDLRETVENTLELLAEKAQSKGLELTGCVPPSVPARIRGDSGRLRQILCNLLSNAVKFTEQGEVCLSVSCAEAATAELVLRFEVRDTGIGFDPDTEQRLFRAFSQADASTTRKYGGTGLGLAICKQLTELMGGQIGVQSQPAQGSTFWFTARFEKCQERATSDISEATVMNQRVLMVDDNAASLNILHHLALSYHMRPTGVSNAAEALQVLREAQSDPFKLAIIDQEMPDMDGLSLARAIKADTTIAQTRLVLLTLTGHKLSPEALKQRKVEACLAKPIKRSSLLKTLSTVLQNRADTLPHRSQPASEAPDIPLRILVAEDNPINQKVTLGQLKKFGFTADVVVDGRQALLAIQRSLYDVVLMDCQMPEMDGHEATRQIRQFESQEERQPVRIIAMTARAMESDRIECLAAGMDDYIRKPVVEAELRKALQRCQFDHARTAVSDSSPLAALEDGQGSGPHAAQESSLAPAEALVDDEHLQEVTGGDPDLRRDLIQIYFAQAEEILRGLDVAVREGALAQVNHLAHTLVGSSSGCGMVAVVKPLQKLEQQGREKRLSGMTSLVAEARDCLELVRPCFQQELSVA